MRAAADHASYELDAFLEVFNKRTGMRFPAHKQALVERRISQALRAAGEASWLAGLAKLRGDPDGPLMQTVVNALTVNETYFYRELDQIRVLVEQILPRIGRPDTPVRVLSLPCSTGEEPYSIALFARDNLPVHQSSRLRLVGGDIDSAALERARMGIFSERSISRLPAHLVKRFFRAKGSDGFVIDPQLAKMVDFQMANLLDPLIASHLRAFDVVFCRNVLIYFDTAAKRRALTHLHGLIKPGGYLMLGHAEHAGGLEQAFEIVDMGGTRVHRKR